MHVYFCGALTETDQLGTECRQIVRSFNIAIQEATIPQGTFHARRHPLASHMVMKSVDLAAVQKYLSHADIQTTVRCARLASAHVQQSVENLDWDATEEE
ncbi:MAG TPA: hypothetical protein EYQ20_20655 [candidate division Zixibacteria bacterium]|nr:hypothetical protein [candidate division Zixibacteria bacterium]